MEEMEWFSSALLGVKAANNLGFGLALAEICQTFGTAAVPQGHDMSKTSHTELSKHHGITRWTHMDEMKWSSCGFLAYMATNILGFGLALAEICQTFGQQQQSQEGIVCPKSAPQSIHSMVTSLIGPIWNK